MPTTRCDWGLASVTVRLGHDPRDHEGHADGDEREQPQAVLVRETAPCRPCEHDPCQQSVPALDTTLVGVVDGHLVTPVWWVRREFALRRTGLILYIIQYSSALVKFAVFNNEAWCLVYDNNLNIE